MWRNTQNTHLPCSPISIKSPSLRKVTCMVDAEWYMEGYFNPHLPCGRWPATEDCVRYVSYISIHTFLAEGDVHYVKLGTCGARLWSTSSITYFPFTSIISFQSTSSLRKVTKKLMERYTELRKISIHTFLAEGDRWEQPRKNSRSYFNPHLPYGRWRQIREKQPERSKFQSTPSLRKVTRFRLSSSLLQRISIHTFLTEGDPDASSITSYQSEFQSTPSLRKVTVRKGKYQNEH